MAEDHNVDAGALIRSSLSSQKPEKTDEEVAFWNQLDVLEPPLDFEQLGQLFQDHNTYQKGLQYIARNLIANGWEWIPYDDKAANLESEKKTLDAFLENCNDEYTFEEIVEKVAIDYLNCGCAALEVSREGIGESRAKGLPSKLFHMPIKTVRVPRGRLNPASGTAFRTGQRIVQVEAMSDTTITTWYNRYMPDPAERTTENGYDPALNAPLITNEVMWFASHNPLSRYYGIPGVSAILNEILLHKYARQFNVNEFENGMLAKFMIVVEEGQLSDQSVKALSEFMSEMAARGKSSAVPVIAAKGKGKIRKEQLTAEIKDMSWLEMLKWIREEVSMNVEVPLPLLGIKEKAGMSEDLGELERNVEEKVISPLRDRIATRFTKMANKDFGLTNWRLMIRRPNLKDETAESARLEKENKMGVSSINDWRRSLGKDPVEGGDELFVWTAFGMVPVKDLATVASGQMQAAQAEEVSKAVTAGLLGHKKYLTEMLKRADTLNGTDDGIKDTPYPDGARTNPQDAAQA